MYPKVDYPERQFSGFEQNACPIRFEYPDYMRVDRKTNYFGELPDHPCWFDLVFDDFNGTLHCSYYSIDSKKSFEELVNDAFTLVGKHSMKTDYRDELVIQKPNQVSGLLFKLEGQVASPLQFFLTDSTTHFLRASLYFNTQVDADSIAPIQQFVIEDIERMISTFEWE